MAATVTTLQRNTASINTRTRVRVVQDRYHMASGIGLRDKPFEVGTSPETPSGPGAGVSRPAINSRAEKGGTAAVVVGKDVGRNDTLNSR